MVDVAIPYPPIRDTGGTRELCQNKNSSSVIPVQSFLNPVPHARHNVLTRLLLCEGVFGRTHDPIDYVNKHIPNIFMAESYLYPAKYDRWKRIKAGALFRETFQYQSVLLCEQTTRSRNWNIVQSEFDPVITV